MGIIGSEMVIPEIKVSNPSMIKALQRCPHENSIQAVQGLHWAQWCWPFGLLHPGFEKMTTTQQMWSRAVALAVLGHLGLEMFAGEIKWKDRNEQMKCSGCAFFFFCAPGTRFFRATLEVFEGRFKHLLACQAAFIQFFRGRPIGAAARNRNNSSEPKNWNQQRPKEQQKQRCSPVKCSAATATTTTTSSSFRLASCTSKQPSATTTTTVAEKNWVTAWCDTTVLKNAGDHRKKPTPLREPNFLFSAFVKLGARCLVLCWFRGCDVVHPLLHTTLGWSTRWKSLGPSGSDGEVVAILVSQVC